MPFGRRQVTVQHRHAIEALAEAPRGLGRQADLRHQHNRLATVLNHPVDGLNVDLRLAAAGHTVDHNRLVPLVAQRLENRIESQLLITLSFKCSSRCHRHIVASPGARDAPLPPPTSCAARP